MLLMLCMCGFINWGIHDQNKHVREWEERGVVIEVGSCTQFYCKASIQVGNSIQYWTVAEVIKGQPLKRNCWEEKSGDVDCRIVNME